MHGRRVSTKRLVQQRADAARHDVCNRGLYQPLDDDPFQERHGTGVEERRGAGVERVTYTLDVLSTTLRVVVRVRF